MRGRVIPPACERIQCFSIDGWAQKFSLAKAAGLDCIEWID